MARLGDYVKIQTGKLDANAASPNGAYPFFTCAIEPLAIDTYSYDCECVLVAGNGDLNVKYYNGKFDAYQRTYIIQSLDSSKLLPRYLYIFLDKYVETLREQAIGGVIKYIKLGYLTEAEISLPDIPMQLEIIAIFEKMNLLIGKRKEQLSKLDELVRARFLEMFGSYYGRNEQPLNAVCNFIDYRGKTPEKSDSGVPLITAKNVKDNVFSVEPQEFIPADNYDAVMTRGFPRHNDVLFTTEAPLGNVCRIPPIYGKFCVGQRIITMQPNEGVLTAEYLEYALLSKEFQDKIWQKSSGSTVKGIRSKLLEWLTIPVPPIDLQNEFVTFVEQTDKLKSQIKQSLEKLETLKKALMQKYFG